MRKRVSKSKAALTETDVKRVYKKWIKDMLIMQQQPGRLRDAAGDHNPPVRLASHTTHARTHREGEINVVA